MKWWDRMPWSSFSECWALSQFFSLSFFTFIKRLFSSSSLSAIRVVSSAYLRFLIFLLAILIPACASSSPAFLMMYSSTLATSHEELTHWKRLWCWEELGAGKKGTTEDEMAGWHHRLNGHEFEWTPGAGDGQGGLACCNSWGRKESDTTDRLNWMVLLPEKMEKQMNRKFRYGWRNLMVFKKI